MNAISLVMLIVTSILVLRTGERIEVEGPVRRENGTVIFRVSNGALFSIPASEVDEVATRKAAEEKPEPPPRKKLRVTPEERDRLLKDLENNHAGKPNTEEAWLNQPSPEPAQEKPRAAAAERDEWSWRNEARAHEEAIRQAEENLELLLDRIARLEDEIRGFLSLGYKPRQFTYQTTQLQWAREAVPQAELEVRRAQRAYDRFRDDARRQGVMPGWLR